MKKLPLAVALTFLFAISAFAGPVSHFGALKVCGNKICGEKTGQSTPVFFKGPSLFWSVGEGAKFYNATTVDWFVDNMQIGIIRAAMGIRYYNENTDPIANGYVNPAGYYDDPTTQKALIKTIIDAAILNDIYVIVDWHSHNAHTNNESGLAKTFFLDLANEYKNVPNIIWEVYNEPMSATPSEITFYANGIITTLRNAGNNNLVLVGSRNWSTEPGTQASNFSNAVTAESRNVAFTFHFYANTHASSGNIAISATTAINNGYAVFASEWSTVNADGYGGPNTGVSNSWVSWMDQQKISSCMWNASAVGESSAMFTAGTTPSNLSTTRLTANGRYFQAYMDMGTSKWTSQIPAVNPKAGDVTVSVREGGSVIISAATLGIDGTIESVSGASYGQTEISGTGLKYTTAKYGSPEKVRFIYTVAKNSKTTQGRITVNITNLKTPAEYKTACEAEANIWVSGNPLYCDYGPVNEWGGGIFEMTHMNDCDWEFGKLVNGEGELSSNLGGECKTLSEICEAGGCGTTDTGWYTKNPNANIFEISTAEELRGLAVLVNGIIPITFSNKTVILTNDIDLEDVYWTPIGSNSANSFRGIFDGQGYTISRLLVSGVQYAGLFGYVVNGKIKEVNVAASEIRATGSNAFSGGLVGSASSITITNSYSSGDVSATGSTAFSGGLVGYGSSEYGGSSITITNSYSSGDVSATTTGSTAYSGGLVGYDNGGYGGSSITNSYSSGNVSATGTTAYSGGLVGYGYGGSSITNSYSSGDVSATATSSSAYSGGLVGYGYGGSSITNSYASGNVSGSTSGGIFGRYTYTESSTISSVYYNSEGASKGIGEVCNTGGVCGDVPVSGILGKSNADLKKKATFEGWDFVKIWGIEEGTTYPYFIEYTFIDISTCTVSDIEAKPYTSKQITPAVSVNCEGSDLTENTDYTVSYGTNRNAGTNAGNIIIIGKGNYESTIVKHFTITPKTLTIDNAQVQNKTYDGTTTANITGTLEGRIPGDEVYIGTGSFTSKNVGNREISEVSLIGIDANNYSLTQPTLTGAITAKPLPANAIQTIASQTYTGADITPVIMVKDGDNTLTSADYNTPIFSSNRNAGSATVSISGKGNYAGTATATFTITAKTLTNDMIEAIPAQAYANGNAIEPLITVKLGTRELIEPRDYSSAYSNNTAPGYATVTITGTGNYTGIATANFLVTAPKDIEDLAIAEIADQTHTGSAITPVPTITDGNYTLVLDQDFVIDGYQSNIAMGNARVIVSGIGIYSGTRQITFKIVAGQIVGDPTPTLITQMTTGKIQAYAANNAIVLQNLPQNAKVQVYNLNGKLISSKSFNQVNVSVAQPLDLCWL